MMCIFITTEKTYKLDFIFVYFSNIIPISRLG